MTKNIGSAFGVVDDGGEKTGRIINDEVKSRQLWYTNIVLEISRTLFPERQKFFFLVCSGVLAFWNFECPKLQNAQHLTTEPNHTSASTHLILLPVPLTSNTLRNHFSQLSALLSLASQFNSAFPPAMVRKSRRRLLKRSIHLAIHEKNQSQTDLLTLAFQKKRNSESLFILRSLQAIIVQQNLQSEAVLDDEHDTDDRFEARKPLYLLLLAALEYHLASAQSVKLVLLGRRLRQINQNGLDRLEEALKILNSTRYVQDRRSRERKVLRNTAFPQRFWEGGDTFIAIARMSEERFWKLVDLIQSSRVFHNQSHNKQVPVSWQLLVTLANLGSSGNGGDLSHLAYMFHISEGSVQNWTNRCIYAILQIEKDWVFWPIENERQELKSKMKDTVFKDTVGFMDGTLMPLAFAPVRNPEDYWTRKNFYAFNVMLVCDVHKTIRFYELGWCGSAHDQRVYRSSLLFTDPAKFMNEDEYLLADSGYTLSPHVITPFKRSVGRRLRDNQEAFNQELSKWRVVVEQSIGMLKGRF